MLTSTEWGVESPWGVSATKSLEDSQIIAKNMQDAGHKAKVVWRGVTPWMDHELE